MLAPNAIKAFRGRKPIMTILAITAVLLSLLLLLVLYRNLPNKKVFYAFCLTLALCISAVTYSLLGQQSAQKPMDESTVRHITAQQQIFDGWYTDYKKYLDNLDYNWQQYQMILRDYHNDNISLNTAYTRLTQLEDQAQRVRDELNKLAPPISLDDGNYDLTTSVLQKTQAYAEAQLKAIKASRAIADPAAKAPDAHDQRSRLLEEAMLRNAPDGLFTAQEISSLRENLTIIETF